MLGLLGMPQAGWTPPPADAVEEALVNPAFLVRMAELPKLGTAEVVSNERDSDTVKLQVRYLFQAELSSAVTKFVVSGASKRGWTTWLTGAVDPRVVGIAPMVIVTLNMKAQNANQIKVWGKYSEQIDDYTERGLMDRFEEPDRKRLWEMVDPDPEAVQLVIRAADTGTTRGDVFVLDMGDPIKIVDLAENMIRLAGYRASIATSRAIVLRALTVTTSIMRVLPVSRSTAP